MSITARCRCGKKYQVKNDSAGKKFRCKECDEIVKVPAEKFDDLEELDDLDDFDDDEEPEEEFRRPVRRKKKRSSKQWAMAKGILSQAGKDAPAVAVQIFGLIVGVIGYLFVVLYFLLALLVLLGQGPLGVVPAFVAVVLGLIVLLGARGAIGLGLKVSRDSEWTGTTSIITGIIVTIFGITFPGLVVYVAGLTLGR